MTQECNNREKILLCAQRLFFEKGYDSVGVQEIVDTAGITKPTMYYYFKSKQGLLACLLEEGMASMLAPLEDVTHEEGTFFEVLDKVVSCYFSVALENQELFLLLVSIFSSATDNEAFQAAKPYISSYLHIFSDFFHKYAEEEPYLSEREDALATALTGMMQMHIMVAYERKELEDMEKNRSFQKIICSLFANGLNG